jgi:hypothetical protein
MTDAGTETRFFHNASDATGQEPAVVIGPANAENGRCFVA